MPVHGKILVEPPTGGYMVHDDIAYGVAAKGIVATAYIGLPAAEAHITDDHVMRIDPEGFAGYTNAVARGGLSFDADIGSPNDDGAIKMDNAGHVKNDDAGA